MRTNTRVRERDVTHSRALPVTSCPGAGDLPLNPCEYRSEQTRALTTRFPPKELRMRV